MGEVAVLSPSSERVITPPAPLAPVGSDERIQTIDVLRGFALFGILWMNMPGTWAHPATWFERSFWLAGGVLADGKFYTTYSFLFGLGFSVQLLRAQARGVPIVPVYLRRLFVLLLIGLAHFLFLWHGDILHDYAIMGVVLLLVRGRSLRTLLVLAACCLLFDIFWTSVYDQARALRRSDPETAYAQQLRDQAQGVDRQLPSQNQLRAEYRGGYAELVSTRFALFKEVHSHYLWAWFSGDIMCMFLLGLYAGRRGIFHHTAAHVPLLRKLMWWALAVGLTLNIADAVAIEAQRFYHTEWPQLVGHAVYTLGRPALCLFYVSGITLLMQIPRWQDRLRPLAWAGRMGLTNYLLQSVIFTTIFYTYGGGLRPISAPPLALALTLLIYPLQILLSRWWMRRFQFGPAEWLWRSLTYGKLQPMRASV